MFVRTVRIGLGFEISGLARTVAPLSPVEPSATVPTVRKPGEAKPLPEPAFGRSTGGADDADGCAPRVSGAAGSPAVVMRIMRVRARPSRSKPMSMLILRRKVAARRNRPASARGLSGQVFALAIRSPAISARAPRSSEAVPVHSVREVITARTTAAIGSASITPSTASSRLPQ
jgi:hypothetical protein